MKLLQDFEYLGDAVKTQADRVDAFFAVGDVGYLEERATSTSAIARSR